MKRILPLLLLSMAVAPLRAQEAKECFTAMPDSLSPLLTAVNRADCIDFIESGMKARVTNRFGGQSEMTRLTPDYIRLSMSAQSTWQMKLLPTADSTRVICTVSTVCATACDSDIHFYTTSWQELPASQYLPACPVLTDFVGEETPSTESGGDNTGSKEDNADSGSNIGSTGSNIGSTESDSYSTGSDENSTSSDGDSPVADTARQLREADMLLMQADLSPDDTTLTFTCTTPAYREKEVAETLSGLLGKAVTYRWQGGIFQRE